VLREVAEALRTTLRSYDRIIRYGGDEFVCLLPGLDIAHATERFALVNVALAKSPEGGSVTFGLAQLRPGDSVAELVARADAELYTERARRRTLRMRS
jgi:diguanylate cyclase (GGDEF)-like protein